MPLSVGDKLGPYEVLSPLGEGGMGQVWKARDTRLNRFVAIKTSHKRFNERFEREAQSIAALNHPHICSLYDVGPDYLVMEYIEGAPIKGPLPIKEALRLALQIAEALDAAHRKGIVHRDLKPANILLTKSGVKLLDFGLAKMQTPISEETLTKELTGEGQILGTLQYMSPEQVQGREADARSDIFSFGLVLYEMITGTRAFAGANPASIIAAILERDAPPLEPEGLNRVVRACLAKDPIERFQSARDLKRAIEWSASESREMRSPAPGGARLAWSVAAALAVGLAAIALVYFFEKPPTLAASLRFQIQPPENAALGSLLNVSPDGRKLAFLAGRRLWVHFFESGESRDLTEASGTPFWSPDSRFLGYPVQGKLKRIEATGGFPQTVTAFPGRWGAGAWNQNDLIVFSNWDAFFRVPAAGGIAVQLTAVDPAHQETIHYSPSFLPDGRHFVYTRRSRDERKSAVYLASVDAKPEQQSVKPLVNSFWGPRYAASVDKNTGYLLFMREETLMAQPFDNRRLELTGQATPVAEQISDGRAFSTSENGVLVFRQNVSTRQLTWYDREGKVLGTVGDPGDYRGLVLSPDGTRAVLSKSRFGQASSLWLLDLSRGSTTQFAFGAASNTDPVWSPDGSRIIFSADRDSPFHLYQQPANGAKDAELLFAPGGDQAATSWSPDGRFVLYTVVHPQTKRDVWVLPMDGAKKPVPFLKTEFNEDDARFSPDGHWVAYTSDESGLYEVYVRSFSIDAAGTKVEAGGKWLISNGGGTDPHWRSDGRELYYALPGQSVMVVDIATNPALRIGKPQPLGFGPSGAWACAPDGKRFLTSVLKDSKPEPYTVVLNWQAGLKK